MSSACAKGLVRVAHARFSHSTLAERLAALKLPTHLKVATISYSHRTLSGGARLGQPSPDALTVTMAAGSQYICGSRPSRRK